MRPLAALSAFLDVSSLNLAAPQGPPSFFRAVLAVREPITVDRPPGPIPWRSSTAHDARTSIAAISADRRSSLAGRLVRGARTLFWPPSSAIRWSTQAIGRARHAAISLTRWKRACVGWAPTGSISINSIVPIRHADRGNAACARRPYSPGQGALRWVLQLRSMAGGGGLVDGAPA
jgi:hypothetical protein